MAKIQNYCFRKSSERANEKKKEIQSGKYTLRACVCKYTEKRKNGPAFAESYRVVLLSHIYAINNSIMWQKAKQK